MDTEVPINPFIQQLLYKSNKGDKKAKEILQKMENGESFYIGKRKYRVINL